MTGQQSWEKGSLIRIPKFLFSGKIKTKYCVLLESWDNGKEDIAATLVTSRIKKYIKRKGIVFIPVNTIVGLPENSLVHPDSLRLLHKETCFANSKFVCKLPQSVIDDIIENLKFTTVDLSLALRVKGLSL